MKIRFTTCVSGAFWTYSAGDIAELPEGDAVGLIRAGFAALVNEPSGVETATVPTQPTETATIKTQPAARPKAPAVKPATPTPALTDAPTT